MFINNIMGTTKYYVDEAGKKCICIISIPNRNYGSLSGTFKGVAKCSPNDVFDQVKGCDLAYTRALLKLKKAEVAFHKSEMKYFANSWRLYEQHKQSLDFNVKRVQELKEELNELMAEY